MDTILSKAKKFKIVKPNGQTFTFWLEISREGPHWVKWFGKSTFGFAINLVTFPKQVRLIYVEVSLLTGIFFLASIFIFMMEC